MHFERGSGILLHITSLPSRFGIGDLGPAAFEFVDWLAACGQKYWQILPLGQTGWGNSPYACFSAFAGNVYLISPEKLYEMESFSMRSSTAPRRSETVGLKDRVDYEQVIEYKNSLLQTAFENFRKTEDRELADDFHAFCDRNRAWLDDYALFMALRKTEEHASWKDWSEPLRTREPAAIEDARTTHDTEIFAEKFRQYVFFCQWSELKSYANEKGVKIVGDIPIYVAYDSADVWCNQSRFKLNEDGGPRVVAGVPPDYFSAEGQLWGNPIYDWERMRAEGFGWWVERVKFNLALFDIVRLDHFIGLERAWQVPAGEKTAAKGEWIDVPGTDLFNTLRYAIGELPLIAEDLGEVTNEVVQLRDAFGISGMRVLQFAFGGDARNTHLPHNYTRNSIVYTATHDNETTVGWFNTGRTGFPARSRDGQESPSYAKHIQHCLKYLKSDGKEINWDMIDAAYGSVANIAIIPMQDVLGMDNSARMNTPATGEGNWEWRVTNEQYNSADADRLKKLTEFYAR